VHRSRGAVSHAQSTHAHRASPRCARCVSRKHTACAHSPQLEHCPRATATHHLQLKVHSLAGALDGHSSIRRQHLAPAPHMRARFTPTQHTQARVTWPS
jgi:hypothetical protein